MNIPGIQLVLALAMLVAGAQQAAEPDFAEPLIIEVIPVPKADASETEWCDYLANRWQWHAEARTPSGARVDLLTKKTAIEVDWCKGGKNYEAVGQALYYQAITGRPGAVILLMGRKPLKEELIHYSRCLTACREAGIVLLAVDVSDGEFNETTLPEEI